MKNTLHYLLCCLMLPAIHAKDTVRKFKSVDVAITQHSNADTTKNKKILNKTVTKKIAPTKVVPVKNTNPTQFQTIISEQEKTTNKLSKLDGDIRHLQNQITKLLEEKRKLESDNRNLEDALRNASNRLNKSEMQKEDYKKRIEKIIEEDKKKQQELEQKIEFLKKNPDPEVMEEVKKVKLSKAQYELNLARLEKQLNEVKIERNRTRNLLGVHEKTNDTNTKHIREMEADTIGLTNIITNLEEENTKLLKQIDELKSGTTTTINQTSSSKDTVLEAKLKDVLAENQALKSRLDKVKEVGTRDPQLVIKYNSLVMRYNKLLRLYMDVEKVLKSQYKFLRAKNRA